MATSDNPNNSFLYSAVLAAANRSNDQHDPFWVRDEAIDAARWNQAFPYQLILVKKGADGRYFQETGSSSANQAQNWIFTLPFPPSSMSISPAIAIQGTVTQGGYLEEHGGHRIKNISLNGSLGVLPLRGTSDSRQEQNLAQAIFAGTIQQATRVATSAKNFAGDLTGDNANFQQNLVPDSAFTNPDTDQTHVGKSSGYYQMRLLEKFFEDYLAFKATADGRNYRLAFAIWKQQSVYLVTPTSFVVNLEASSPLEPTYSLQFRAYRRIKLDSTADKGVNQYVPTALQPNVLQSVLQAIIDARDVLENARDVLGAVGGDLDHSLFEPLRQTALFLKDALNVPLAFSELPLSVISNCQQAIVQYVATAQAFTGASQTFQDESQAVADAWEGLADYAASIGAVETQAGLSSDAPSGVNLEDVPHPALDVFRHPHDYHDFYDSIQSSQVNLPPVAVRGIVAEREAARSLSRLDFETVRDSVLGVLEDFSDAVGAGDPTFNAVYNRAPRAVARTTPTSSDWQVIFSLNDAATQLNRLAASGTINQNTGLRGADFVAGLARQSGIAFTTPRSKYPVPFPYGHTLEQLAIVYLGDPDRWIEIAALNGLRAPYVDEVGFDLPLVTNGNGNQVQVADASNLYVGQSVWIASATAPRTMRHVTRLDSVGSDTVVTVDGDPTMGSYSTVAGSVLHAFLPDTVNSQQMLYIPSPDDPPSPDYQLKAIPGLDVYDQLFAVGGVDLLLTPSNDLAITPDGDCLLAVGLTNIIQTARIRLSVRQGTLLHHPEFGLPIEPGISLADVSAKQLLKAAQNLFSDDPVFTGVLAAGVSIQGPVASIGLNVGIRGQSSLVPVTFAIPTS